VCGVCGSPRCQTPLPTPPLRAQATSIKKIEHAQAYEQCNVAALVTVYKTRGLVQPQPTAGELLSWNGLVVPLVTNFEEAMAAEFDGAFDANASPHSTSYRLLTVAEVNKLCVKRGTDAGSKSWVSGPSPPLRRASDPKLMRVHHP
jgi:hypothetical protein